MDNGYVLWVFKIRTFGEKGLVAFWGGLPFCLSVVNIPRKYRSSDEKQKNQLRIIKSGSK